MPLKVTHHAKKSGFALVIALSLMSFVVLLLISLANLANSQRQSATLVMASEEARLRAMDGLMIAMEQLQFYAGADQRVTVPATTVYPQKDVTTGTGELYDIYRSNAQTSNQRSYLDRVETYLTPAERIAWNNELTNYWESNDYNPHWTGVYDTTQRVDRASNPNGNPDPMPAQIYEDGDPDKQDNSEPIFSEYDRAKLPAWLVSGNEQFDFDPRADDVYPQGYLTPNTALPDPAPNNDSVWVVGLNSATEAADSSDGLDGRVKVKKVPVNDTNGSLKGHYAYWVSDESLKANVIVQAPDPEGLSGSAYLKYLQAPQRSGWDGITGLNTSGIDPYDPVFLKLLNHENLESLDPDFEDDPNNRGPVARNFHHLTFYSSSLMTDTALGGLKKDLTQYLENRVGLNNSDAIADRSLYDADDSRFAAYGGGNQGFPRTIDKVPTWGQIKAWYDNREAGNGIMPDRITHPVLTYIMFHGAFSYDETTGDVNLHFYPCIMLWNPYDVKLNGGSYDIEIGISPVMSQFYVGEPRDSDPGLDGSFDANKEFYYYLLQATSDGNVAVKDRGLPNNGLQFAPFEDTFSPSSDTDRDIPHILKFNIDSTETEFEAGEVKVFTLEQTERYHPRTHAGSSLKLVNFYDVLAPDSFYFPVINVISKPSPDDLKFYFDQINSTIPSPRIKISISGDMVADTGNRLLGVIRYNNMMTPIKAGADKSTPSSWRNLYAFGSTDFDTNLNTTDPDSRTSSIWPYGETWLQPINFAAAIGYGDGQETRNLAENLYPAFSQYNVNATIIGDHPLIDAKRYINLNGANATSNNSDKLGKLNLYRIRQDGKQAWNGNRTTGINGHSPISLISVGASDDYAGLTRLAVRTARRREAPVTSIGQLQQVNLSYYNWQPSFPIANGNASPYCDRAAIAGINARTMGAHVQQYSGHLGVIENNDENMMLDLSYLLNESLWDRYFMSAIDRVPANLTDRLENSRLRFTEDAANVSAAQLRDFDLAAAYLRSLGSLNVNSTSVEAWVSLLAAFRDLELSPNSGSANPRDTTPIARSLEPYYEPVKYLIQGFGDNLSPDKTGPDYGDVDTSRDVSKVVGGFRYLNDDMIRILAERIVDEVRLRGPFYSLADFVNRRLIRADGEGVNGSSWHKARTTNDTKQTPEGYAFIGDDYQPFLGLQGLNGALQRAIDVSGINGGVNHVGGKTEFDRVYALRWKDKGARDDAGKKADVHYTDTETRSSYDPAIHFHLDAEHIAAAPAGEAGSTYRGTPGHVSQGDILSMIGSALTARGDTFKIRTYGDSIDPTTGEVVAKVWLEAIVQRIADPVTPAGTNGQDVWRPNDRLGRRFIIVSYRWLDENSI